ncbi:uncharacterized protein LOC121052846 [Rosa chinensis]|uniref:uncharacterized protein LOC121052846 n=1 Tax=Rosa chinensis TaxID=74649 RepID=UPI001AD8AFE0|nr:uncharacterized protein LOC121052846 [Rosa chinensis]
MIRPFYEKKLTETQLHKHEADLEIILKYFDVKKAKFVFGETEMEITLQDINELFDLPTTGIEWDLSKKVLKEERKASSIFDVNMRKETVIKPDLENKLSKELGKKKNADPKIIAALLIMYLFNAFFFSRTSTTLTWDLINACEDIDNINSFNWAKMVLDFLLDGLQRYRKDHPTTLSGCIILIYYWFLEKTKIRNWIPGMEDEKPRFVRWSIKELFNLQKLHQNPDWPEELIKEGPWLEHCYINLSDTEEEQETPSFNNWVPQASQDEEEETIRLTGNMKVLLKEMDRVIEDNGEKQEMEKQMKKLLEANEGLANHIRELWKKVTVADEKIESMEKKMTEVMQENRSHQNHIKALKKCLAKGTSRNPDLKSSEQQNNQQQMVQVSTEKDHRRESTGNFAEYDTQTPVNEEPRAADPINASPISYKSPEREVIEDTHLVTLNEMESEKIDQLVSKILEAAETVEMPEGGTEMAVPSVPREKKTVDMHSIERNVKVKKRKAAVKDKDDDFEYDTPEILKTYEKKRKTAAQEQPKQKKKAQPKPPTKIQKGKEVQHQIQIKEVNCEKYTWKTLKPELARHYQQFFEMVDDNTYVYWSSENGILGVTRGDMKIIVEEKDLDVNVVKAYTEILQKEMKETNTQIGLLNIEAAFYAVQHEKKLADFKKKVKHIRRFIHDVKVTGTIFPGDSQDQENTREKCKGEDSKGELVTEVEEMTPREKEVRRWILDNQIGENDYELVEDLNCPQQKSCSDDCGPFMIHFMESIVHGVQPSKKKGNDMRKTILERFAKEESAWSVEKYLAETADAVGEPKK